MPISTVTLASGQKMPLVGFGLWKVPAENCSDIVYNAIKIGYRLFDGAYDYANEEQAGEGIRRAIHEGLVRREEIFVTTKLWNNYHRKEHAIEMAKAQNEAWGLGYIDLYLMHYPVALVYIDPKKVKFPTWWTDESRETICPPAKVPIHETWAALEEVVSSGIVKSIGVCNAQSQTIYDILTYARYPISVLQIEHHPYLVQHDLLSFCHENGVQITAFSSFGPQSWLELSASFKKRTRNAPQLFENEAVKLAAARLGVTPAQVLLRWATQRGIAVIPKSNHVGRLKQNLEVIDFDLTKEEIEVISALDRGLRFNDPGMFLKERPLRIFA